MAVYVVAGVTGRVGSVVATELIARGETPRIIVRNETRAGGWARRGAEVAVGSLDDQRFVAKALRGARGFFTLLPENVPPDDFHAARRRMADAMAAAVADSGVPHVVMLSAIAAVLSDGNGPARDLHYFEQALQRSGSTLTALRACYFQDNIAGILPAATQAGIYPNFMTSADARFPMIATKDVARVAADALVNPPPASEIIDVLGPACSIRQLAEKLGAALGKTLEIVNIPPAGHVAALTQAGMPQSIAEAVAEMFAAFNAGLIVPSGDRRLFGTTSIDEVIADSLQRQLKAETLA